MFNFADSQYHDRDALRKKLNEQPLGLDNQTRTDLALKMAKDELFTDQEEGGDRPDHTNVMIVLTDGKPTHPNKTFDFKSFAEEISKELKVGKKGLVCVRA